MSTPVSFGTNTSAQRKRVKYTGTSVIYKGMPLCYNFDTTANILGINKNGNTAGTTTAEGYQNEGKFLEVEDPAATNFQHFAGVVAAGEWVGKTGSGNMWIEIFEPNGATVPVYAYYSCVVGSTQLGLTADGVYFKGSTGDDDPVPCALAMETVDRSTNAGIVLAKIFPTGQCITALGATFAPTRSIATGDAAGIRVYVDSIFNSTETTTGPRSYGIYVTGDRAAATPLNTSAGCDDAGIRIGITNRAVNSSVYNFRGINVCATNRASGVVGELSNIISVNARTDGGAITTTIGLKVDNEYLSSGNPTEYGGIDIALCREGGAATTEYGLQIRTRGTINTAIAAAIRIDKQATDYGFTNLFSFDAGSSVGMTTSDGGASTHKIPILDGSTTRYLMVSDG